MTNKCTYRQTVSLYQVKNARFYAHVCVFCTVFTDIARHTSVKYRLSG